MKRLSSFFIICAAIFLSACVTNRQKNEGNMQSYPLPDQEAVWIQNGDPIDYEGTLWYPQDGTESLQDSEVYILGEYKGIQFFVDREDVRPFNRLYTKFAKNKFRFYKKH